MVASKKMIADINKGVSKIVKYVFRELVGKSGFSWIRIGKVVAFCACGKGISGSTTRRLDDFWVVKKYSVK